MPNQPLGIIIGNSWKGKGWVIDLVEEIVSELDEDKDPLKAIKQKVNGVIDMEEWGGLIWEETAGPVFLRYAFVTLGPEEHILPALLLDDWGNEKKGLGMYGWVEKEGLYFPRAEIFGYKPDGQKTQIFLRDLDLVLKYRVYAYPTAETPLSDGRLIETIFLPDKSVTEPTSARRPPDAPKLLGKSAVRWVKIPA